MTTNADKIIVALDLGTAKEALTLVNQLRDKISFFKIGLQLYTSAGPDIVRTVRETGARLSRSQAARHPQHGRESG